MPDAASADDRAPEGPGALAERLWWGADDDVRSALAAAERGLDDALDAEDDDVVGVARLRTTLAHLLIRTVQPTRAAHQLDEAAAVLEAAGDQAWLARCLGRQALLQLTTGADDEGFRTARRAVRLALDAGVPGVALVTLANVGSALVDLGDPLGAIEQLAEALNLADVAERRADVAMVLATLSEAFHAVGDVTAAERYGELAVVTADQDTAAWARLVGRLVLATAYGARGDHEAAVATAADAEALAEQTGVAIVRSQVVTVRMASLRALGRPAEAVDASLGVTGQLGSGPNPMLRSVLRERLLANLDLGDTDAVRADADRLLADADPHSPARVVALEALAEMARRAGDHRTEAGHLRAALDAARRVHTEETKRRNLAIRSRAEVTRAELDAAEHRRRTTELQRALEALERDRASLLAADADRTNLIAHLERLADEDALTGLPNRRRLERAMQEAPDYLPLCSRPSQADRLSVPFGPARPRCSTRSCRSGAR